MYEKVDEYIRINQHNVEMLENYKQGEEGIDYVKYAPGKDPNAINEKQLEKEIKSQIEMVAIE